MYLFVFGTTAEFIKIWPVANQLKGSQVVLISTNQQPNELIALYKTIGGLFPISVVRRTEPLTKVSQIPGWILCTCLNLIKELRRRNRRDDIVIVHGDTMTSTIAAMISRICGFKVAHIEAGLRSYDWKNPFPEELNRRITAKFANYSYAPSLVAMQNLASSRGEIVYTYGNTVLDAFIKFPESPPKNLSIPPAFGLISLHRSELVNSSEELKAVVSEVIYVSEKLSLVMVIDALTWEALSKHGLLIELMDSNVLVTQKLEYPEFKYLLRRADFIITDSGGQQEESFLLGLPTLVYRKATERGDGIGQNAILSMWKSSSIREFSETYEMYRTQPFSMEISPSQIIVNHLRNVHR